MGGRGMILAGFPRTKNQATWLNEQADIGSVFNVDMDRDIVVQLLNGRRVCPKSGNSYNVCTLKEGGYDLDPLLPKKDPEHCDVSGERLVQRDDDKPEVVRRRLEEYDRQTAPVLDYFKSHGKVVTFAPKRGV